MTTQKQVLESLCLKIESLEKGLPNGNIIRIESSINEIKDVQKEMKVDVSNIQKRLFDPDNGLIVETNKSKEFREICAPERIKLLDQFMGVLRWKRMVEGGLAVIFASVVGVILKLMFY